MEMRRYVRHSPAWWIVGGILALLTAGCIVLGLLAQRDSAAAEAVPIGDEIYLGDYNYIDVQYMTTWAYRVTLGDGRKLVFYLAEDTEGYGYLVQLNDAEYARYADIVDYTYADDSGDGAVPDDTAAPSELAVYIPLTETTAPAPVRLAGVICETPEAYIDDIAAAVGMTAEDFVYTYGDYYIDSELTPDTGSSFWSLIASFLGLAAFVLLAIIGVNMVRESFGGDEKLDDDYSAKAMLPLAVATSIDAFAVGVSFAAMQVNILPAAGLIGCITCLLSAIGVRVGALFGDKYRAPSERIGGIVLILIGLKTLLTGLGIL